MIASIVSFVALMSIAQAGSMDCQRLTNDSMTSLSLACTWTGEGRLNLRCLDQKNRKQYDFHLLGVLSEDNGSKTYCASLTFYRDFNKLYDMDFAYEFGLHFNQTRPTALVVIFMNSTSNAAYFQPTIKVVTAFAASPQATYTPSEARFWDFSSPLWGVGSNWLSGLYTDGYWVNEHFVNKLENTSLISLELIQTEVINKRRARNGHFLLPYLPKLKKLTVVHDSLADFSKENYLAAPKLEELNLRWNKFRKIPEGISAAKNLRVLDLSDNYDMTSTFLPSSSELSQLQYLEQINLSCTTLFHIRQPIPKIPNLRLLNISRCQIGALHPDTFVNLPNLQILDLSYNSLSQLLCSFPKSLRVLYARENILKNFSPVWNTKQVLNLVDISSNTLEEVPRFTSQISVHTLDLSENKINKISNPNCVVKYLNLSLNSIQEWTDENEFSFLKEELNMSRNAIAYFTDTMRVSLNHLHSVDLWGNTFDCTDCRIKNVQKLISQGKPALSRELACFSPSYRQGFPVQDAVCIEPESNLWLNVGIPLGTLLFISLLVILLSYRYRFELVYLMHVYKMRAANRHDSPNAIYDAFVCYSGHDRAWVLGELAPMLETGEEKYRLCLHDRDFLLGSHIQRNIVHSIDRSRRTIIVLSQHFVTSRWCQWELDRANHRMFEESREFVILLERERLDRAVLPRHLKYLMDTRTYLEWPKDPNAAVGEKKAAIKRLKKALGTSIFRKRGQEIQRLQDVVDLL